MPYMPESIFIKTSDHFSFKATVYSHGWCELPPFELDEENWRLKYVFRDGKRAVSAVISEVEGGVRVEPANSKISPAAIERDVRHLLRLDDDLDGFYEAVFGHDGLGWVTEKRAGRLLRSATVFEDLVKTICTTNCSWGLTKNMVSNLVEKLGSPAGEGQNAFPTAEAMAGVTSDFYREE
ncbi:MAG TPA: hypothetical protein VHQ01_02585, partial [Pyrinomonadaceae bacterium]|nr:hypothetical protein [Pyrinomonadaceae bacterium]